MTSFYIHGDMWGTSQSLAFITLHAPKSASPWVVLQVHWPAVTWIRNASLVVTAVTYQQCGCSALSLLMYLLIVVCQSMSKSAEAKSFWIGLHPRGSPITLTLIKLEAIDSIDTKAGIGMNTSAIGWILYFYLQSSVCSLLNCVF